MKLLKVTVVIVLLFIVFSLISISFYLQYHGKYLLEDTLKISLNRDVNVGYMSIHFPLGVSIQDFIISGSKTPKSKNILEVKKINVQLELLGLFNKQIKVNEIILINPHIFIEKNMKLVGADRSTDKKKDVEVLLKQEKVVSTAKEAEDLKPIEIYIEKMYVRNGVVEYNDNVSDKNIFFTLNDFYLKSGNLYFPFRASQISFDFQANVTKANGPLSGSKAKGKGWVDIVNKDMEAMLELFESDGRAGLTANFVSKNNDMLVQGDINVDKFSLGVNKNNSSMNSVADQVFGALLSMGVEVGAHYSFKTKMDDIRVNNIALTGKIGIGEK
ncbi:MAG: AsmA family protein [Candidatus Omnitrophica bacterium]|nr:AsmA family protein [Candidatus Omnitrophota bacterium]MBU1995735.1 AsmA family protein [Candidatus Omnitrophota bacterium]